MIQLPAISVGPRDRGRSYGVLDHSLAPEDFQRFRPILEDLSLALAAWADLHQNRFVALTPLDAARSAWILWRARHLGAGELGTIARANGLMITAEAMEMLEGRPHRLLPALPGPDEDVFGGQPVTAAPQIPTTAALAAFGLEWRDQVIELLDDADPEAVLVAVLEGVSPGPQIARIDGWASTGALAASGGFDPADAFRLIVRPQGEPRSAVASPAREVQLRDGQILSPPEPEPAVWRAWRAVDQARSAFAGAPAADWKPAWLTQTPDRPASLALLQAAAALSPEARLDLIAEATANARTDADLTQPMGQAAAQALLRLAASADDEGDGALYVEAGLTEARFGPATAEALAGLMPLEAAPSLSKPGLERALASGLMARLGEPEAASVIAAYPPTMLMTLLGESLRRAEASPPARGLAVQLIRTLSEGETLSRRYAAAGVSALSDMAASEADVGLATPAVAVVVREHPRVDAALYAARAVQPLLRGEVEASEAAFLDGLRAAARLLEPAE
jgi:hypothetical protein